MFTVSGVNAKQIIVGEFCFLKCFMGNVFHDIHFGTCKIPRTEKPGGLQSMESQRVRHN